MCPLGYSGNWIYAIGNPPIRRFPDYQILQFPNG